MKWILLVLSVLLTACTHRLNLVDFENGTTLVGSYNELNKDVIVTMPDGEVLKGKYTAIQNIGMGFGSAFATGTGGSAFGTGQSVSMGASAPAYTLLSSTQSKLMMEIKVIYSQWSGKGFGEAITNDGRKFKVTF